MFKNRDAIGQRLRELRQLKRVGGSELAAKIGCTQSLISKIETGKIKPSIDFVKGVCDALSVSATDRNELLQLTDAFLFSFDRWGTADATFADLQEAVRKRELQASIIQSFSLNLMSGLVQTEDYARTIFSKLLGKVSENEVRQAVSSRLRRQAIASDPEKVIQIVISEASLATGLFSPSVMLGQLEKLLALFDQGNIEIKIVPLFRQTNVMAMNSFSIYDRKIVSIETQTSSFQFWEQGEIEVYDRLFQHLITESLGGKKASSLIEHYCDKWRGLRSGRDNVTKIAI